MRMRSQAGAAIFWARAEARRRTRAVSRLADPSMVPARPPQPLIRHSETGTVLDMVARSSSFHAVIRYTSPLTLNFHSSIPRRRAIPTTAFWPLPVLATSRR